MVSLQTVIGMIDYLEIYFINSTKDNTLMNNGLTFEIIKEASEAAYQKGVMTILESGMYEISTAPRLLSHYEKIAKEVEYRLNTQGPYKTKS